MSEAYMEKTIRFPKILVSKNGQRFEAVAGLELKSILKGDLLVLRAERDLHVNRLDPEKQQEAREAFLHAISSWPPSLSLELHIAAMPDLVYRARGRLLISMFLRVSATTEDHAKEEIVNRYLSLMPFLGGHFPEAEFIPITNKAEMESRRAPFAPCDALAIHRRQETLSLSTPLKRLSVGFGPVVEKTEEGNNSVQHVFPWVPSLDDWARLMDTLAGQLDPLQIIIRLRPCADHAEVSARLDEIIRTCEMFLSGVGEYQITLTRQASLIRDMAVRQLAALGDQCFNLGVFVLAPHPIDTSLGNVIGGAITGPRSITEEAGLFQGGFACTKTRVQDALKGDYFPEPGPFTVSEAACAFRLPSLPLQNHPGLATKCSRTSLALLPAGNPGNGAIELVMNEHQGMVQPVVVNVEDRMRHTFIIGQTGTGKSTLMEGMILQDIRAGRGLAVIDPHGDMVDSILGRIPRDRAKDVILFDMTDTERPLGLNLLQWKTLEERDLIIDELYQTLHRVYDFKLTAGPVFESNFRAMLKLLMGDGPRGDFIPTLLEFTSCYLSRDFRRWLKKSVSDHQTLDFLEELERTSGDASLQNLSPYITSKFSRFVHDTMLVRIVGQAETSFDFDEVLNNSKILLVRLGKGRFGPTVTVLLANQIVSRFKLAAMKRGKMRPKDRRDFFLYVDECHNLPSENFMELLSEARKFRVGCILATQYTAALLDNDGAGGNTLLSAIFGNVGTSLIFRVGHDDAARMAPFVYPYFTPLDIIGLPNWHGYARLQMNQEAVLPFSFRTQKDETAYDQRAASRIRTRSRLKYGTDARAVDDQIARRRRIWKNDN
ncbi:MAG TPA: DUF87 domain-containing protein [Proteobacteria bacterium]|nr:DUF87 domain-containing protein [Pseudomonadota bacterium]